MKIYQHPNIMESNNINVMGMTGVFMVGHKNAYTEVLLNGVCMHFVGCKRQSRLTSLRLFDILVISGEGGSLLLIGEGEIVVS